MDGVVQSWINKNCLWRFHLTVDAAEKRCLCKWVLCCLGLTLLLHLFLLRGEGTEQRLASPIRELACWGAPLLGLQMNKLYPEILSTPPPPFQLVFYFFPPPAGWFVSSELNMTAIYLFSPAWTIIPPCPHPVHRGQWKQAVIKVCQRLLERAQATWQSLRVHVAFLCSLPPPSQLCFVWRISLCFSGVIITLKNKSKGL